MLLSHLALIIHFSIFLQLHYSPIKKSFLLNGLLFLQMTPIPVQVQTFLSWIGIIFDWMILLRIFVFRDHLKGIFWNSLLVCMRFRDWILIMYVLIMYIMCLIIFEEKSRSTGSIPSEPEPGSKSRQSYSGS